MEHENHSQKAFSMREILAVMQSLTQALLRGLRTYKPTERRYSSRATGCRGATNARTVARPWNKYIEKDASVPEWQRKDT